MQMVCRAGVTSFNPRARVGRDRSGPSYLSGIACFNPRARVGRDLMSKKIGALWRSFNPRARVGRDIEAMLLDHHGLLVSIHAPAWGATIY